MESQPQVMHVGQTGSNSPDSGVADAVSERVLLELNQIRTEYGSVNVDANADAFGKESSGLYCSLIDNDVRGIYYISFASGKRNMTSRPALCAIGDRPIVFRRLEI